MSSEPALPIEGEFLDALRRHICQVLGFDLGFIDIAQGSDLINLTWFSAQENESSLSVAQSLEDENKQPLTVAQSQLAQSVWQSGKPWVGRAQERGAGTPGLAYVIVPIIEAQGSAPDQVRGLLRVVSLDETREISDKDISTLRLIGQHLADRMPDLREYTEQARASGPIALERESVLVALANRLVRRRISKALSSRYQVTEADSSERTVELLQKGQVDLLVMDTSLQGKSGYSLCKMLKESTHWKHIPIILVTGEAAVGEKVDGLNAGADDCLPDSCHEAELLARARSVLRLRKTERELATQLQLLEDYAQRLESATESERQANLKLSKDKQSLEQLNKEVQQRRTEAELRRNQDLLLHRISNILRRSFNIKENVGDMLESLAGWLGLDCCFVILPADEESEDEVRSECASSNEYTLIDSDTDLAILEIFKENFPNDQALVVNDVSRDKLVEPFKREALNRYHMYSLFYVPITYEQKLLGLLGGHKCESEAQWTRDNEHFLCAVADQVAVSVTNARLYLRVQRQATTDGLTGLFNHRTGQEKLAEQLRMAERYQRHISLVMCDVDHFKAINDSFGHPAGDAVLRAVARLIRNDCRDVDIPVRYGGEEFLLILPEITQEGAVIVAERIRKKLMREVISYDGIDIQVTASIGVATYPEDAQGQQLLLDLADKALYMSKRLGRNRVHTATDLLFNEYKSHPTSQTTFAVPQDLPTRESDEPAIPEDSFAETDLLVEPEALPSWQAAASSDEDSALAWQEPEIEDMSVSWQEPLDAQAEEEKTPPLEPTPWDIPPEGPEPWEREAPEVGTDLLDEDNLIPPEWLQEEEFSEPQGAQTDFAAEAPPTAPAEAAGSAELAVSEELDVDTVLSASVPQVEGPVLNPPEAPAPSHKLVSTEPEEQEELSGEVVEMVKTLATALYSKSTYNKRHHLETARFAELLANVMGLTEQQIEQVRVASLLHDVGILSIPDEIINKPGLFSEDEMEIVTQHSSLGAEMLRPVKALREIAEIVECHHECWDGTGYPRRLKGEEIPLAARIVGIVDAYHAMVSDRPYRRALTREQALRSLRAGAGTQWDPFIVDIFCAVIDSIEQPS